ncbi:hypothetical protein UPYG_G00060340 [Umbra pygmaea]|uniref:Ig-like domain-containing protein n=1 Tax=Umbra pygmaea TaxID=75934 RepID=A0ABD0X9U4_UMBPY
MTPPTFNEGQNVTLSCSSTCTLTDNPTYTWYKKNVTSPKASGQSYSITNIRSEDTGEYYCEAKNEYGRLKSSNLCVDVHSGGVSEAEILLWLCLNQSVHPDPNSDTYTALIKNSSPDYINLTTVHAVPNSDPYTDLNIGNSPQEW